MTIKLSIPDELDRCQACRAKATKDKFCDLSLVDIGPPSSRIEFSICHDCALILIEELLGRYHALWGLALVYAEARPGILSTILSEIQAIRSHLDDQSTPDQDLPSDVEDALAGLGRG